MLVSKRCQMVRAGCRNSRMLESTLRQTTQGKATLQRKEWTQKGEYTTIVEVQKFTVLHLTQRDEGDSGVESPVTRTSTEPPPKADSPALLKVRVQPPRKRRNGPNNGLLKFGSKSGPKLESRDR